LPSLDFNALAGTASQRLGRPFWHTQELSFFKGNLSKSKVSPPAPVVNPPAQVLNSLDSYIALPPHPQNMIDIFAGEWSSKFPAEYGWNAGAIPLFEDLRIHWIFDELRGIHGMRVVELGPLEGGHSFMLDRAGAASVLAIESNRRAFLKCLIVKELLGLPSVQFVMGDFREYFDGAPHRFDLCVASGVLYHMREPVALLSQIAAQCDRLFLWTHYYDDKIIEGNTNLRHRFKDTVQRTDGEFSYELHHYNYLEGLELAGFCGGNAPFSHWLTREGLFGALQHSGFREIRVNDEEPMHQHGPCLSLLALK